MEFLFGYFLVGLVAFWWTLKKEKADGEDYFFPMMFVWDPLFLLAWIVWPVSIPIYRMDLRARAALRAAEKKRKAGRNGMAEKTLVGQIARVVTRMNPTGIVEVDGNRLEAKSEEGLIEEGAEVMILRHHAGSVTVTRKPSQPMNSDRDGRSANATAE